MVTGQMTWNPGFDRVHGKETPGDDDDDEDASDVPTR